MATEAELEAKLDTLADEFNPLGLSDDQARALTKGMPLDAKVSYLSKITEGLKGLSTPKQRVDFIDLARRKQELVGMGLTKDVIDHYVDGMGVPEGIKQLEIAKGILALKGQSQQNITALNEALATSIRLTDVLGTDGKLDEDKLNRLSSKELLAALQGAKSKVETQAALQTVDALLTEEQRKLPLQQKLAVATEKMGTLPVEIVGKYAQAISALQQSISAGADALAKSRPIEDILADQQFNDKHWKDADFAKTRRPITGAEQQRLVDYNSAVAKMTSDQVKAGQDVAANAAETAARISTAQVTNSFNGLMLDALGSGGAVDGRGLNGFGRLATQSNHIFGLGARGAPPAKQMDQLPDDQPAAKGGSRRRGGPAEAVPRPEQP